MEASEGVRTWEWQITDGIWGKVCEGVDGGGGYGCLCGGGT